MRALRQTFVLTRAIVAAVDQSVKQAATNFPFVIKSTNSYVQDLFHHTLLITNMFPSFCDLPSGSFISVQGIQSAI
jgi:hypothetical protein